MEIKYTNFEADKKIFGKEEICGIYDITGGYLYDNIYDTKTLELPSLISSNLFLKINCLDKKELDDMISELEIDKSILKRKPKKLSKSELLKISLIKIILSDAKTIILDHIDEVLNAKDLTNALKTVKKHIKNTAKTVIYATNNPDNLLEKIDRFLIIKDGKPIYNGTNILEVPVDMELKRIVDLANKKGAHLDYYRDINDLLKAIYRSVK